MSDLLLQRAVRAHQAGDLAEAARLYGEVLRAAPRNFPALYAMGFLHYQAGRFEEAQRMIAEAIRINPRSADAFFTRACALHRLNRPAEALVCFDQALALKPDFIEAQTNRAAALMALNRHAQALDSLDVALAMHPSHAAAWNNRGCVLEKLGRHREAIESFEKAIAAEPGFVEARINRGSALSNLKRYAEAARDFERALSADPHRPYARGNLIFFRMQACDWRHLTEDRSAVAAALKAGQRVIYPFVHVALSSSLADQLRCARIWMENDAPPSPTPLWRGERYRHDRIRIAYVSADFHAHATAALMAGVFEQHDKSRFETIAISFGPDDGSAMRARVAAAFDRFIDAREKSEAEIAALIRQMEVDIAVDLKGYTQNHRSGIFAFRPAPVQASYLGYPGTMGAPYIDYIIADRIVIPEEHRPFYTEKIAYLPDSYQCNDAGRPIGDPPARAEAGLPPSGLVFCCFNNSFKITPDVFDVWTGLLREVPGSVLWLLEDNADAKHNLKREAEARGVAAERLVFAPRIGMVEHLARHSLADLFLDTLPYGAHTTASDSLWAGVPVVTMLGESFAGRVAASLLHAVGLPELVTESLADYAHLALRLAREDHWRAAIKARLLTNRATHPLFDTLRFTRNLEAAYLQMWRRSQDGLPPCTFWPGGECGEPDAPRGEDPPPPMPEGAVAAYAEGCRLAGLGRTGEALAAFDQALAMAPDFVEALTNRGALLVALNRHEQALESLDKAVTINPAISAAWNNRGNALSALGRHKEAVESYDRVLRQRPGMFEALVNRGTALIAAGRAEEALASYEDALRIHPKSADALNGRANALFELKRFPEAISAYEALLARDPGRDYALGNLAFCRLHCCEWRRLGEDLEEATLGIRAGRRVANPFQAVALLREPEDQKRCAEIFTAGKHPPSPAPLWTGERYAHDRIRIAYLSAEFRDHAVAQAMAGVIERHDLDRFETVGVSWGADDGSEMRRRLIGAFNAFLDVTGESDRAVARRLRDMEIDIAIDLMGFTGDCRPGIFAARPAPVQVNFVGFPGTMGAPYIDYVLADRIVIPEDAKRHFSEAVAYLPDAYLPTDGTRQAPDPPSRREAGLPDKGFVFACFNNSYKLSPELFGVWMRLLKAVEGSVLWLSSLNPAAKGNLIREASARGVDPARLIFAPFLAKAEDHLRRLAVADLFLDTLPYNAHATAVDALLARVPVLTCKGTSFAGRVAASLLHAIGLAELATGSLADYEALALALAREPARLAHLKARLSANRATFPLFDTERFTRHLETLYVRMWERRMNGEPCVSLE